MSARGVGPRACTSVAEGAPPVAPSARPRLRRATAAAVRARMAAALLDAHDDGAPDPGRLGEVVLRPHQRDAVRRLRAAIAELGGALLADEVGLGKTYVALAIARDAERPLVLVPAALRAVWAEAMRRTGVRAELRTLEAASRAPPPATHERRAHDLVVVDEAHHLRNPATRRWLHVAALAERARVLLLSATPVHNRRADLDALLALFLGARAGALDAATLARCVVRRDAGALPVGTRPPRVRPPVWLPLTTPDDVAARLLALPPPLPPVDGGEAGALVAHALLRLWSSSAGALRAGLRRRLVRAEALESALAAGHHPSDAELRAWVVADDAVQLAFPELLAADASAAGPMLAAVRAHRDEVRRLLAGLDDAPDVERAARLRELRLRHPEERIVAFSCFADTVAALHRLLRADGGICALTGDGARVAGGALTRGDALRRFAPRAHGAAEPPPAERITMLLSTDVLSEGIGLQDASVVVHLDLPWTPARLAQRVGRVARLGSTHHEVSVYALAPPSGATALLAVERRLRDKRRVAGLAAGAGGAFLPRDAACDAASDAAPAPSPAECAEATRVVLADWRAATATIAARGAPDRPRAVHVAAVRDDRPGAHAGWLALVAADGRSMLLASGDGGRATDDPCRMHAVVARAGGEDAPPRRRDAISALRALRSWWRRRRSVAALGLGPPGDARLRGRAMRLVSAALRRAPRHRRRELARLAVAARTALGGRLSAGAEHRLAGLADRTMPDAAWLRAVASLRDGASAPDGGRRHRVVALLLVVPATYAGDGATAPSS